MIKLTFIFWIIGMSLMTGFLIDGYRESLPRDNPAGSDVVVSVPL
jgi:hypothetical protein